MADVDLSDVMSIHRAAKAIGMRDEYTKDVAARHGLLIRWGKQVRVSLPELKEAIMRDRLPVPGKRAEVKRPKFRAAAHEDVRC